MKLSDSQCEELLASPGDMGERSQLAQLWRVRARGASIPADRFGSH